MHPESDSHDPWPALAEADISDEEQREEQAPAPAVWLGTVFVASGAWLARFAPAPTVATSGLFAQRLRLAGRPATAGEPRAAAIGTDTTVLPRHVRLLAYATDRVCLDLLAVAGRRVEALPDGGDPDAVRRLALVIGLAEEGDDRGDLGARAAVAASVAAFITGLPAARAAKAAPFTRAATRLALARWETPEACPDAAELRALANTVGLWPVPALRPGGTPLGLSAEGRAALHGAGAVYRPLFEAAAAALIDLRPAGLLPPGPVRPVLLAEPPAATEEAERVVVDGYRVLLSQVAALPAPEPARVADLLAAAFPWMASAIRPLLREIALARLVEGGACRLPPLLLLGPPGVGKSRFCRAVAEACGLPMTRVSAPDASLVTELAGSGRGWRSARPCAPVRAILASGIRNPVIVVDDLDRAPTGDHNGNPFAVLLGMLETETAKAYLDSCLAAPVDVSAVNWIATANSITGLPSALLSRVLVVEVSAPPVDVFDGLLAAMIADIAAEIGAAAGSLPALPEQARTVMRRAFSEANATPRLLRRALRAALGALALGEDPTPVVRIVLESPSPAIEVGFPRSAHAPR